MTRIKWTPERLKEDALKYKTRTEWCKNSSGAYNAARNRGLLDECCAHMKSSQRPNGFWNLETLQEDASKYNSRSEWEKRSRSAYYAAQRRGLLDECCAHMKPSTKTLINRCIYRIYAGNEIYIGLTYDVDVRFREHKTKTKKIIKLIERHGIDNVKFEQITDYMDQELAQIAEAEHIESYRNNDWVILNRAKAGALGKARLKWNLETLQEDASKYNSRSEWEKRSRSAYYIAQKRGLLDECCAHMTRLKRPNGFWNLETLKEDASVYKTRNEWRTKSSNAYSAAKRLGLIDECCGHMPKRAKRK
ncbi:hypothetical protein [Vibrio phage VH7D]|uniref:GIY-YIG domain-containing protein n=1 Tax=Vibrio phage VH7D TaxID=1262539 RepID=V9LZ18_9CAUD|nr:hypothetical protein CF80_gp063 [Vibrio phage VH7D]AGB06850.1 hypothetical protein [Vibrio phage VH7D]